MGFASKQIGSSTWSYTLTLRLGELLREAEAQFGPRDQSYTILGIEFGGDIPCTWYPGDCGHVSVRLTDSALQDPPQAYFQLAHEVVHLLAPTGASGAPTIEEGVATMFAHDRSQAMGVSLVNDVASYLLAEREVRRLLAINPSAIREIRTQQPRFDCFTADMILAVAPGYPRQAAEYLCTPFSRE